MDEYRGPDRRKSSDFEREVVGFMARIDEHMANQNKRCDSHAADITCLDRRMTITEQATQYAGVDKPTIGERTEALESDRSFFSGVLKAVGIGIPTLASVAWAGFELWKYAH